MPAAEISACGLTLYGVRKSNLIEAQNPKKAKRRSFKKKLPAQG